MPIAAIVDGARAIATVDGPRRAECVDCGAEMLAKTGEVVVHHWAHRHATTDGCGAGETEWHLAWKSRCADVARVEVSRGQRRADLLTPYGWAVEFQHSALSVGEVGQRERDWGKRMIWVFDARGAREGHRLRCWRPQDRQHHTIEWAWSKAYVVSATVPSFVQIGDDGMFLVGRWFDKTPGKPLMGYGWRLSADEFADHVIDGCRPPTKPAAGQPLNPARWSARPAELECPTCGEPLGGSPLTRGARVLCSAASYHVAVAA